MEEKWVRESPGKRRDFSETFEGLQTSRSQNWGCLSGQTIVSRVFENHRKSLILHHCERSELRLHFDWIKVHFNCQKLSILRGQNG